ncbi:integral membrane protein [Staphylococcus aureus]|nr:integral membrane protein [Staphylococcus aureus]
MTKRQMGIFIYTGIIGGLLSGIVKLGWEVMFPPRTPERNATNPPQELLQQLGFSSEFTHQTYTFSNMELPWVSFIVHFSFSIVIAIIYCILVKKYAYLAMGQGAVFGIVIWVLFHLIIMPIMHTVPAVWDQPFQEHISELFGHVVWMMTIELVRQHFVYRYKLN